MKQCSNPNCVAKNPIFSKNKTKKDGLNNQCKDCVGKLAALRYKLNRDKILKQNRTWRLANPEKMKSLNAKWARENRTKRTARIRSYRIKNIEATRRQWIKDVAKRNAIKLKSKTDNSSVKDVIAKCSNMICYLCNKEIVGKFHIDHVIPLSRGGDNTLNNKMLTHPFCNLSKHNKLLSEIRDHQLNNDTIRVPAKQTPTEATF